MPRHQYLLLLALLSLTLAACTTYAPPVSNQPYMHGIYPTAQ